MTNVLVSLSLTTRRIASEGQSLTHKPQPVHFSGFQISLPRKRAGARPRDLLQAPLLIELQRELLRTGQFIPGIALEDPADLARSASIRASSELCLAELAACGETEPPSSISTGNSHTVGLEADGTATARALTAQLGMPFPFDPPASGRL